MDSIAGIIPSTSDRWTVDTDILLAAQAPDHQQSDTLRRWWNDKADEATTALLRLDRAALQGVNINDQTARALRLRPQRFQRLSSISADGVTFPTDPDEFRAETFRQARDLYGSRPDLRMDIDRLRCALLADSRPPERDTPDYRSRMLQLLQPEVIHGALLRDISSIEARHLLRKGSDATALDELPRRLLLHLPAHGLAAALHLLRRAPGPPPSDLLLTAIHLPLRKKEPRWLLHNSRPVLLQPYLRRLEATAIFQRQQRALEASGSIPSEMYAYRPQLAPQQAGLLNQPLPSATRPAPRFLIPDRAHLCRLARRPQKERERERKPERKQREGPRRAMSAVSRGRTVRR
jgi:hypothetical protein